MIESVPPPAHVQRVEAAKSWWVKRRRDRRVLRVRYGRPDRDEVVIGNGWRITGSRYWGKLDAGELTVVTPCAGCHRFQPVRGAHNCGRAA